MHTDSKKRRSSYLVVLLFAAGDAKRYLHRKPVVSIVDVMVALSDVVNPQELD